MKKIKTFEEYRLNESKISDLSDKDLLQLVKKNDVKAAEELLARDYFDKEDVESVKAGKGKEVALQGLNSRISRKNEAAKLNESELSKDNQDMLLDWIKKAEGKTVTIQDFSDKKAKPTKAKLESPNKNGLWKQGDLYFNFKDEFKNPNIEIKEITDKVLHFAIEGGWDLKITK